MLGDLGSYIVDKIDMTLSQGQWPRGIESVIDHQCPTSVETTTDYRHRKRIWTDYHECFWTCILFVVPGVLILSFIGLFAVFSKAKYHNESKVLGKSVIFSSLKIGGGRLLSRIL